jgi:acyl dehydratase
MATSAEEVRLAELPDLIGQSLGPTEPLAVTQERIEGFARETDDFQWIHTDPQRASAGVFGGTIAHGFLTLAFLSRFLHELIEVLDAPAAINYGLDRVRFPSPLPSGSSLQATAIVLDVRQDQRGVLLTARVTMTAVGADKPACVADSLTLYPGGLLT